MVVSFVIFLHIPFPNDDLCVKPKSTSTSLGAYNIPDGTIPSATIQTQTSKQILQIQQTPPPSK